MTIRDCMPGEVLGEYTIGFNDETDETVFFATSLDGLEELWRDFCYENGFNEAKVDYVYRSKSPLDILEDFMRWNSATLWRGTDGWHAVFGGNDYFFETSYEMIHEMYSAS